MSICNYCMHRCDKCGMCTELKVLTSGRKKKCNMFLRTPEYSCKNCLYLRQYDPFNLFCIAHCVVVQNDTVPCNDFKEKDF